MDRIWKFALMIVGIILADQFSKAAIQSHFAYGESIAVIDGAFNLTYVKNKGAAFGMLADANEIVRGLLFLLVPVLACFWLAYLIWAHRHKALLSGLMYSLILAGAVGNLIDRFSYGHVVDFLDFYWKNSHFPAFNVADSAISIGAVLLIVEAFIEHRKAQREQQS